MPDSQDPKQVNNNDLRNAQFGGGFINAENVNAGRIGGDIWNIFLGQQTTPVGNPARPKNERILLAAVKEEVTARLRHSLHNAVLINLGKESQPQQVKRPWDAEIKIGLKPAVPLADSTTILEVFDSQEVAGKLLILGAPGSGKTTTQLELTQALVSRAEEQPDYPLPILFNLSSWKDDRQSITDWLVVELKSKYGVSKKLGQDWVDNKQLLPLLDGLDELEPQHQELCVNAINQFLAGETRPLYLVVCSRIEEYNNYATQLQLKGAICLQLLTSNQICDYLTSINSLELWSTISSDLDLLELMETPLLLNITVLVSQEISREEWQHLNSTSDRIQYLLDAYIGRMLTRNINSKAYLNNKAPNTRKTRIWLVWLAKQMQQESKTEFLIEEMQPSWLKNQASKTLYKVLLSLMIGISIGIIFKLLYQRSIIGIIVGIILGITYWLPSQKIVIIKTISLSELNKRKLLIGLAVGIGVVIFPSSLSWILLQRHQGQIYVIIIGIMFPLLTGLLLGQPNKSIEKNINPNQDIWHSVRNAFLSALIIGTPIGLFVAIIHIPIEGGISGITFGLIFGLVAGGDATIQHFILRLILYFNGYIPWNYARFLDYCTERMLLQRVGGRYRFIHKLLQDHFAQMDFRRD
ncbi:NACHT domain-containing protein [Nostocaceae cyanobacterium CENA369]|uniref:NACHT domain-containing protein n=1 Tax=Dendronalium phyllosphericum CENA369 TaxID=1725256 RepID=A0A8J7LEH0_9NOST|nr:NACHT domain-containing protein [Dendronalium phyllosphericum]MBH8573028.1 NACHT domain-containing protein [Dendronalium phyllosphericum CENA369]